jgi:hypothetical protein
MGKAMSERFIQNAVAERLNKRYYRRRSAYVATEAYTKLKRADVLLAFLRTRGRPYVVVVEAKSRGTIHQLKLRHDDRRVRWVGRILGLLLVAGILTVVGYQWYVSAVSTVLAGALFLVGSAVVTTVVRRLDLRWTRQIGAIRQLARYPANESWIAVGEDTFVRPAELQTLRRQCRKEGIGLIVVNRKGRLRLDILPAPRHVFNDYLSRYGRRDEIMEVIGRRPEYGATRSERRQNRQRYGRIALLLLFVGLLLLFGYERREGPVVPDPFGELAFRNLPDFSDAGQAAGRRCEGVNGGKYRYVVIDTVLEKSALDIRLQQLRAIGLRGMGAYPEFCFRHEGKGQRWIVTNGGWYGSVGEARRAAEDYRILLTRLGEGEQRVRVGELLNDG